MSKESLKKYDFRPIYLIIKISQIIYFGFFIFFLFLKRNFIILEQLFLWGFLLIGLTIALTGLLGIINRELPLRGKLVLYNAEAIAIGLIFILLGLTTGIGLFFTW